MKYIIKAKCMRPKEHGEDSFHYLAAKSIIGSDPEIWPTNKSVAWRYRTRLDAKFPGSVRNGLREIEEIQE